MNGLERMRIHSEAAFQRWLAEDFEAREELRGLLPRAQRAKLDVEPDSLDVLEAFLLDRYADVDAALRLTERPVLDAASRHVGLVMILNVDGATWAIDLEDEDNAYYRLPIIRFSDGDEECPLSMVTTSLDRRTGRFMHELLDVYIDTYNEGGADG